MLGRGLGCAVLILVGSSCFAQEVAVRVVDSKGYPFRKQPVSVFLSYGKGEKPPAQFDAQLKLETDANGKTRFTLPEPAPSHISVQVEGLSERDWKCVCFLGSRTQVVIEQGKVVDFAAEAKKAADSSAPAPGQILFIAHRMPFLMRLLWPLYAG